MPHLHLSAALQAEWEMISRATAAAQERLKRTFVNLLSPTGRAVLACGQAAYSVGQSLPSLTSQTDPAQLLQSVFADARSARTCSSSIDEAARAAETEHCGGAAAHRGLPRQRDRRRVAGRAG